MTLFIGDVNVSEDVFFFLSLSLSLSRRFLTDPLMEYKIILPLIFAQADCLDHI